MGKLLLVAALFAALLPSSGAIGTDAKPSASPPIAELEFQVAALATLNDLSLTSVQLQAFQKLSADTAAKLPKITAKGNAAYHTALLALRDALVAGDDEKIAEKQDAVDDLRDKQNIDPQTDVDITQAAAGKAATALKLLSSSQIARYLAIHDADVPDATETILDALDQCHGISDADYAALRDEAADQVALLAAGQDSAEGISAKVRDLLDRARKLDAEKFKAQRADFDAEAHQITQDVDSMDALRNWMEREMADLLSNPTISEALAARIK
jgi:hypothetical protein